MAKSNGRGSISARRGGAGGRTGGGGTAGAGAGGTRTIPGPGQPGFPGWPARHDAKGPSGRLRYSAPKGGSGSETN